jgi:uncharacterized phage-associated protein
MTTAMRMSFDEVKATQVAARFLQRSGGAMQHLALIKLLYKADREALRRWGVPVTTARHVSMKLGPVVSEIYDLIKASGNPDAHPSFWGAYIKRQSAYDVALSQDPGGSELSRAEEKLIDEIFEVDGQKDGFTLAEETHRIFPEWKDPGSSSYPIELSDILDAIGASEDEKINTAKAISAQRASRKLAI